MGRQKKKCKKRKFVKGNSKICPRAGYESPSSEIEI
jgi:hypothetical protein